MSHIFFMLCYPQRRLIISWYIKRLSSNEQQVNFSACASDARRKPIQFRHICSVYGLRKENFDYVA
jgi:hypothetical protein